MCVLPTEPLGLKQPLHRLPSCCCMVHTHNPPVSGLLQQAAQSVTLAAKHAEAPVHTLISTAACPDCTVASELSAPAALCSVMWHASPQIGKQALHSAPAPVWQSHHIYFRPSGTWVAAWCCPDALPVLWNIFLWASVHSWCETD